MATKSNLASLLDRSQLYAAYTAAEGMILAEMAKGFKADPSLPGISRLRRYAGEVREQLVEVTPELLERELRKAIELGTKDAFSQILRATESVPTAPAIAAISTEVAKSLSDASQGILRVVDDIYREATRDEVSISLIRGETVAEARNRLVRRLAGRGVTGFTDTSGRNWNLSSYSEMAVRTAKLRSYRVQHSATLRATGIDLVMIYGGNDMCEYCRAWTNKVVSLDETNGAGSHQVENLDGKPTTVYVDGTIEEARQAGLEHPNCRCTRVAYIPGLTNEAQPSYNKVREQAQDTLRGLERDVRRLKREKLFSDNPSREQKMISRAQSRIRDVVKTSGIERNRSREQVSTK